MALHFIKKSLGLATLIILQSCTSGGGSDGTLPIGNPNAPSTGSTTKPACTLGTATNIIVSGQVQYERVMQRTNGVLDYNNIVSMPIRGATVQLMCGNNIVATDVSDESDGRYSFAAKASSTNLYVRVRAELKKVGAVPGWNFTVVDNTRNQALYVMDSAVFNSQQTNISNKNLLAASGFNGNLNTPGYSADRTAAPFAILDSVFKSKQKILTADAVAQFPAVKINWSVNNNLADGNGDVTGGDIASSFFGSTKSFSPPQIYILGDENSDTDEYDEHVIIHEWGHYFEHFFSRSDSIGGSHSGGDKLDMRVAFGEGFGNAFSGMVTDDAIYRDSNVNPNNGTPSGFSIDVDDNACANSKGFYSECSVQAILYDLYDSGVESGDTVVLGLGPIYNVLTNEQKTTDALTSIFSFITPLKQNDVASNSAIDTLVSAQDMQTINDVYGNSETNNNPGTTDILPVFEQINVGGTVNVCSTAEFRAIGQSSNGNKLAVNRYLRFTLNTTQNITVTVNRTSGITNADPDIEIIRLGVVQGTGESTIANTESVSLTNLAAGEYIIVVYEFSYYSSTTLPETTCFNVAVSN